MSKMLKTVGTIAVGVALLATGVGAIGGAGIIAAATATKIGTIASLVSATAMTGSQITAPKPRARGSVTQVIVDPEPPRPYMIGESFSAGVLRHQPGYGATLKKVPNPFLWQVKVFSGVGPVQALVQEQFDFGAIGSYYNTFYDSVSQLGARPESAALVPPYGAAPGWGASSRLSGCAAIGSNYKFDRDGKVFASGIPLHGAIWQGEKVYDPRLDTTYPGGSGAHRLGTESTYTYSTNPALHAAMYAYGRYQNGIRIFGLGLTSEGIDWPAVVDWANDCEANTWQAHGTIYEGGRGVDVEAQRVQNLDDICAAGGGRWLAVGGKISFDWHHPRVPLATLTDDDWLEEGGSAIALQSVRDRMNGVRPQYTSPAHNWEQITADEIIGTTYRTEDGTPLTQTWPLNLVKAAAQAGELASYVMADSREVGPIEIAVGAEWRFYKPGETLTLNSALLGYNGPAVILNRSLDPATMAVRLTLKTETAAKHDFALGKVAVPPPTPIIGQDQEERDAVVGGTTLAEIPIVLSDIVPIALQMNTAGVTTTPLPVTRQVSLTQGETDRTSAATWTLPVVDGGLTASINASGLLSITAASSSGSITVRGVLNGVTYERVVSVTRSSGTTSGGGSGGTLFSDNTWPDLATDSFVQVTDVGALVNSGEDGQIDFNCSAQYYSNSVAVVQMQRSTDGSTWTNVGAETTGSAMVVSAFYASPGFVGLGAIASGLTADTDYYVRLIAKVSTASTGLSWLNPVFSAQTGQV